MSEEVTEILPLSQERELHAQENEQPQKRKRKLVDASSTVYSSSTNSNDGKTDDATEATLEKTACLQKQPSEQAEQSQNQRQLGLSEGWRVKLYRLNSDGSWDDCGTGRIVCLYKTSNSGSGGSAQDQLYRNLGEPTLFMQSESTPLRVLLRTKILLQDAYQRQGDNIITWCESSFENSSVLIKEDAMQNVDLALSFQDNAGCLDIWHQINQFQARAAEWFRNQGIQDEGGPASTALARDVSTSVTDMAQAVAAAHHANLQQQQQRAMWINLASESQQYNFQLSLEDDDDNIGMDQNPELIAVNMAAAAAAAYGENSGIDLPTPPALQNLEDIVGIIASIQSLPQREALAIRLSKKECSYFQELLQLFVPAESRQDYGALATLAACVKTILLLNDPSIIDFVVHNEIVYELVCSTLEYDPDLRDKANHRWFLKQRAKFRTVVMMEDDELINIIHRSFRVTYLRDTLLRPTMDEASLSTLTSLQTFTNSDVVKGITSPIKDSYFKSDSYLVRVMRLMGKESRAIAQVEWEKLTTGNLESLDPEPPPFIVITSSTSTWTQHLAPQDDSLQSRRIRLRGCLSFLRELFDMVKMSLQQSDKDDFFATVVTMEVYMDPTSEFGSIKQRDVINAKDNFEEPEAVDLLSLLAAVLADPIADVTDRGNVLEIICSISMHDPSHIRRHSLKCYHEAKLNTEDNLFSTLVHGKPIPNEQRQVFYKCPPKDLMAALLFLLAIETDAGVLLQATEILRIILDTDIQSHGMMTMGLDISETEENLSSASCEGVEKSNLSLCPSSEALDSDQNHFLSVFYEHYIQWLVVSFQFTILHPRRRLPDLSTKDLSTAATFDRLAAKVKKGFARDDDLVCLVESNAIRGAFAIELLCFCVRSHHQRMRFFLLKSRVLSSVLKLLDPKSSMTNGDRCLKLAILRLLRSVLAVTDELYVRHIIQQNVFGPVFDAFRANPVGDNLVSSAILEICDFIQGKKIESLVEHIVTKHLVPISGIGERSLEEIASPYVKTFSCLRKSYLETKSSNFNRGKFSFKEVGDEYNQTEKSDANFGSSWTENVPRKILSQKALEDQRKFRQADAEESYFDTDDVPEIESTTRISP